MYCVKCLSKNVELRLDRRSLAELHCNECGATRKIPSAELLELYLTKSSATNQEEKPPCKYCNERFFLQYGRLGSRYVEIETAYCPKCGRKLRNSEE